jgi:hypothetical protein
MLVVGGGAAALKKKSPRGKNDVDVIPKPQLIMYKSATGANLIPPEPVTTRGDVLVHWEEVEAAEERDGTQMCYGCSRARNALVNGEHYDGLRQWSIDEGWIARETILLFPTKKVCKVD